MAQHGSDQRLLERALRGKPRAVRQLVDKLTPVIQARVARGLTGRAASSGRTVRQEVEDLTQEVFVSLFADNGRGLRAWDPERGLSLANFVGLLAQRQVSSIMRSGRRSPWTEDPVEAQAMDMMQRSDPGPEPIVASREQLAGVLDRLRESLSPRGLELFYRLMVNEEPIRQVCETTGMTPDAVYAWRSRLAKLARQLAREMGAASAVATPHVSDFPATSRTS